MNMWAESATTNVGLWNAPIDDCHFAPEFEEAHVILGLQGKSYNANFRNRRGISGMPLDSSRTHSSLSLSLSYYNVSLSLQLGK